MECVLKSAMPQARGWIATVGEQSTLTVHAIDTRDSRFSKPIPLTMISCELVMNSNADRIKCGVKASKDNKYEVDYLPTHRGRHQLHIKVFDHHIRGSPSIVVVLKNLEAPIRIISGFTCPWGVTINRRRQIILAEYHEHYEHCISIYSPSGEKIKSFGKRGSAPGQFLSPRGVAVDRADNILVVDGQNRRIQEFTAHGNLIAGIQHEFQYPSGIGVSPSNKVYVCDTTSIKILNPDLAFLSSFGSKGRCDRQFQCPWDVAFDSQGNVYVADSGNHRIQVFTEDGQFLRKFGKEGEGEGELSWPASVAIDSDDVVYVAERDNHRISIFTSEGHFLRSFGRHGMGPGQFKQLRGVAVDKDRHVYISDLGNQCLYVY